MPATGEPFAEEAPTLSVGENRYQSGFRGFDVKTRLHSEEEYQSILRRLDLALGASHVGVWEHSLTNHTVTWDQRMHRLYGTEPTADAVPVDIWMNAIHPDDREAAIADFDRAVERKGSYRSEFRIVLPDGSVRYIRSMANYFLDSNGQPGFIGAEWDVTADVELARALAEQRRLAEERATALQESREQIEYAADHDYLTGLPNRRLFDRLCRQFDAETGKRHLAVMHVDLDHFKEANDLFGHEAGDRVLKAAARAIRSILRPGDVAARMGGDEFVVVSPDAANEADLRRRAQSLVERIGQGIEFEGKVIRAGASLGIAVGQDRPVGSLLKDADVALYSAKRLGRGRAVFYRPDMQGREPAPFTAGEIRAALEAGHIRPLYRYQSEGHTGELAGLEAVAFWDHDTRGRISLEANLPELREMGLLQAFELHMVGQVIEDLRFWQGMNYSLPRVSLAISGDFFASSALADTVRRADRLAARLCFELSASDSLKDLTAPTLKAASLLKALGAQLAVSGIRDGDGSLIGLLRLRPDRLKLDPSMLDPSINELEQPRVLQAVSDFAHAFGMTIVADISGCPDQNTLLGTLGCLLLRTEDALPCLGREDIRLPRLPSARERQR